MMILLAVMMLATAQDKVEVAPPPTEQPEKMICRKVGRTGSHLSARKVCRSASDWSMIERQAHGDIQNLKLRNQAGNPGLGPN